jgi:hypothetical protein
VSGGAEATGDTRSIVRLGGYFNALRASLSLTAVPTSIWQWSATCSRYSSTSATSSPMCCFDAGARWASRDSSGVIHWKTSANSAASTISAVDKFFGV